MKNSIKNHLLRGVLCALAVTGLSSRVAQAHPYAAGVTLSSGTVTYILNENATDVKVVLYYKGVAKSTNDLGAGTKGLQPGFSLGTNTSYAIIVNNTGSGSMSETTSAANTNTYFFGPRGVSVNQNPSSTNFGRIYVNNASPGLATNSGFHLGRLTSKGVFALNADQSDAFGYATNGQIPSPMVLGGSTTYSPYKLGVGPDDMVYVCDGNGPYNNAATLGSGMWMVAPNLATATRLFNQDFRDPVLTANTSNELGGAISTPCVTGSYAAGTLNIQVMPWDGYAGNYVLGYNIGSSPLPYTGSFTTNAVPYLNTVTIPGPGVISDLAVGTNGYYYILQERTTGTATAPEIAVFDDTGTNVLWNSYDVSEVSSTDSYHSQYGIAVTYDLNYMVSVMSGEEIAVTPLTNGVPNYSANGNYMPPNNYFIPATNSGTARGIAVDLADNIYTVSGGSDRLRAYSLGLTTTCITSNDVTSTNGSFSLAVPQNGVSVAAVVNTTSQNGSSGSGEFTVTRTGQTGAALTNVTVVVSGTAPSSSYSLSGSMNNTPLPATNTINFAANQLSTNIFVNPINDGVARPSTTVTMTVLGGGSYTVGNPGSDTVYIINNGPQTLQVTGVGAPTMYKEFTNDYASFIITRTGDTNYGGSNYTAYFAYTGTAVSNVDYIVGPAVMFGPGQITATSTVSPTGATGTYTGNKSIIAAMATDPNGIYTTVAGSATMTLLDNAYPAATVLWADPLTDPNDATNWAVTSANNNMATNAIDDTINFGYDLTSGGPGGDYGYISLPPNGATTALRVTLNKSQPEGSGAAAGVNLYPTNVSFGGSYALRFDMNLIEGYELDYATEGALFGINHNGTETNWWSGSGVQTNGPVYPWAADGLWYWIDADAFSAAEGDYIGFTGNGGQLPNTGWEEFLAAFFGVNSPSIVNALKNPTLFTTVTDNAGDPGVGVPANFSPFAAASGILNSTNWANVELKQLVDWTGTNYTVALTIDKTLIYSYAVPASNHFNSGTIMLGYDDPFSSVGGIDGSVYFSNLKVVRLAPPAVTSVGTAGANVVINFTSTDGDDTPASFYVQSTASLVAPITWANVTPAAVITQNPANGSYTATTARNGPQQFYRVRKN